MLRLVLDPALIVRSIFLPVSYDGKRASARSFAQRNQPLMDAVLGAAWHRSGTVPTAAKVIHPPAGHFPAERVRDRLRRSPREREALISERIDQLGHRLGTVLSEVQRERVAEFDSAQT